MREFIVNTKNNNNKVSNCIKNTYPNVPISKIFIALRNKDIRVNDIKINNDILVNENDKVTVYIKDSILFGFPDNLEIIYEDDNILIINKPVNLLSEKDSNNEPNAEDIMKAKLNNIDLKLCHRLDRNTSGLLIFTKNNEAYEEMLNAFKESYIKKKYLAYVVGILNNKHEVLKAFLLKDNNASKVTISTNYKKGYEEIITEYKVLDEFVDYSLLEVTLHTGKTHQIRAHLASIFHAIIGDGKYGDYAVNKKFKNIFKTQALTAYKYEFNFPKNSSLNYLNNITIELKNKK